uniref:Putative pinin n=1 Tax=Corethrella appendiculata TaxID=1370023 RepID=U5ETU7_9DIPT
MGTEVLKRNYGSLEEELEAARTNLKGLNENIRRIIGRDVSSQNSSRVELKRKNFSSFDQNSRRNDRNSRYSDLGNSSSSSSLNIGNPPKRRNIETKSVFSRLSGPPARDDDLKPRLHSRVIKEQPTRQEIVAAQGTDEQSRARNRRIFGSLLGTLQKFSQEESRLKPKEEKKAQIEKKLEEQAIKERENLRKEKQNLFTDRKRQQIEIKAIESKMAKMKELEDWEKSFLPMRNYIRTKSKPHLYYIPKKLNSKTEEKLRESRKGLETRMEKKREEVLQEVEEIEARFKLEIKSLEDDIARNQPNTKDLGVRPNNHSNNKTTDDDDDEFEESSKYSNRHQNSVDNGRSGVAGNSGGGIAELETLQNFKIVIHNEMNIKQEKPDKTSRSTTNNDSDDNKNIKFATSTSGSTASSLPVATENLQITFTNESSVTNN